jgi:hypothetical protein
MKLHTLLLIQVLPSLYKRGKPSRPAAEPGVPSTLATVIGESYRDRDPPQQESHTRGHMAHSPHTIYVYSPVLPGTRLHSSREYRAASLTRHFITLALFCTDTSSRHSLATKYSHLVCRAGRESAGNCLLRLWIHMPCLPHRRLRHGPAVKLLASVI